MTDKAAWSFRRRRPAGRELRRLIVENAHQAIEGIDLKHEIYGLFKGQFSLADLIVACLAKTGPADIVISTWTAAKKELSSAERLLKDGRVVRCRWLVDFSFPRRQPGYCEDLRKRFGDDVIRVSKIHSKFVLFRNKKWDLVLVTSANLNKNVRLETFQLMNDAKLADFFEAVVDEIFEEQKPSEGFERRPSENVREFEGWGVDVADSGPSPFGVDLNDPMNPGMQKLR